MPVESGCVAIFRRALEESSRDYRTLMNHDMNSRKKFYMELGDMYIEIKVHCEDKLGKEMAAAARSNLKLAQLKVAIAIKEGLKNGGKVDRTANEMVSAFSEDEYEAMKRLERFSVIDSMSSESIRDFLKTSDNQIYKLIKEWYNTNMDNFLSSMAIFDEGRVSIEIRKAMEERYNTRFQKITEGIISFIQSDPTQLKKLFDDYEREIKLSMDLEHRTSDVEERLKKLISSNRMTDLKNGVMEATLLLKNRDFESLRKLNIQSLLEGLRTIEGEMNSGINEIETDRLKIAEAINKDKKDGLRDMEVKRIDATLAELKNKVENDVSANIGILSVINSVLDNSSRYGKDTFGTEFTCSIEDAKVREVAFFESVDYIFNRENTLSLTNPSSQENMNIYLKDLVNKKRASKLLIPEVTEGHTSQTTSVLYRYQRDRIFGKGTRLSMAFIFNVNRNHGDAGNSARKLSICNTPFTNMDLARVMGAIIESSSMEDSYIIAIVGSPNGFEKAVIDNVRNQKGSGIQSRKFSLILMDTRNGNLVGGDSDIQATQIIDFMNEITGSSGKEETEKIWKETEDELSIAGISRLGSIVRVTGAEEKNVLSVWSEMEKARKGSISKMHGERVFKKK